MMEQQAVRSLGGRLALWLFWVFCIYFAWNLLRVLWSFIEVKSGPADWFSALSAVGVRAIVGAILGAIAWFTRPANPDA